MRAVIGSSAMREIEQKAMSSGITQEALMEEAGKAVASYTRLFIEKFGLTRRAYILAGKGNNGGDAYAAARWLLQEGCAVHVLQVGDAEAGSLVRKQRRRYEARGGKVSELGIAIPTISREGVIIDGLFGTGFHGSPDAKSAALIDAVHALGLPIISVDLPSGLDAETGEAGSHTIRASCTVTMELPKLGFFFDEGWNHVGALMIAPIGLAPFCQNIAPPLFFLEAADAAALLPPIRRTRHKYEAGHVVGLAGSAGMCGAALMASWSALRAGCGIVHLLHPWAADCSGEPLEVVRVPFEVDDQATIRSWMERANACFVGPGLGNSSQVDALLASLFPTWKNKSVIDADALSWLARSGFGRGGTPQGPLPGSILTPHTGEMHRLLDLEKKRPVTLDFVRTCQQFVDRVGTHLVLKGGPSFLLSPREIPVVLAHGDPGMATAGAGDVLTGILAALLAQGLKAREAMLLGSMLHSLSGEHAADQETAYCLTASSLIEHLPHAFQQLMGATPKQLWHIDMFATPPSPQSSLSIRSEGTAT